MILVVGIVQNSCINPNILKTLLCDKRKKTQTWKGEVLRLQMVGNGGGTMGMWQAWNSDGNMSWIK